MANRHDMSRPITPRNALASTTATRTTSKNVNAEWRLTLALSWGRTGWRS